MIVAVTILPDFDATTRDTMEPSAECEQESLMDIRCESPLQASFQPAFTCQNIYKQKPLAPINRPAVLQYSGLVIKVYISRNVPISFLYTR